jgi:BlaR1 peptidase M56
METIFIYLLKSSAILAVFFLCYHFLVQKETFFNSNRWFLLLGLFTSILLPLFFIKKIVWIERKAVASDLLPINSTASTVVESVPEETFNWLQLFPIIYTMVGLFIILKIVSHLLSLYRLLHRKEVIVHKPFALVDINEEINPFSFFKYIVFNSNLYSKIELESILTHEKVHSREKHSIDVLIAKVFCAVFWFNPFAWLYKKAILQNLEYIADQKAIQHIEDKKAYQMTLLKVVTDHNYLSITNSFYQSLIKKRIVMLNKNQSKQHKIWKYAVILPALIAFVVFFQVKVIAQEKTTKNNLKVNKTEVSTVIVTKNSSDEDLSADSKRIKNDADIDLKFSKIKRNKKGEITAITATFNDNKGGKGQHKINGDEPISPFKFSAKRFKNGQKEIGFFDTNSEYNSNEENIVLTPLDEIAEMPEISEVPEIAEMPELPEMDEPAEASYDFDSNFPSPPSPPAPPTAPSMKNMPAPPIPPNFPAVPNVKVPADPRDRKAWAKYEADMTKFADEWENSAEMKKFQAQMAAYEKKMEKYQPDMTAFEKAMEKFEAKMEQYQDEMEAYQEAHLEKIQERQQAKSEAERDAMEARREAQRDAMNARREAQRDAMEAKRDAMEARREALEAKKEAERKAAKPRNN